MLYLNIEVSVIIPSFNKFPLNLYTLYSLEHQDFDLNQMEVIFIDDASTDNTSWIEENYKAPFNFRYIRCEQTLGRSKARNMGINLANGRILIFLDAEMMVNPNFVTKHYHLQQTVENSVISGGPFTKKICTVLFPDFNHHQKQRGLKKVKKSSYFYNKYQNSLQVTGTEELISLLEKEDVMNKLFLKLVQKKYVYTLGIEHYFENNLTGFELPWMGLFSGNVSFQRDMIRTESFDENFVKYGFEDWELGYRLYKKGFHFLISKELGGYHQEHPITKSRNYEKYANFYLFTLKHPEIDVLILGLKYAKMADLMEINQILKEYKSLLNEYPDTFGYLKTSLIEILKTIVQSLTTNEIPKNLLMKTAIETNQLQVEMDELKELAKHRHLIRILEKLINQ